MIIKDKIVLVNFDTNNFMQKLNVLTTKSVKFIVEIVNQ